MNDSMASLAHDVNNKLTLLMMHLQTFENSMDQGKTWQDGKKAMEKIKKMIIDIGSLLKETVQVSSDVLVDVKETIVQLSQAYEIDAMKIHVEAYGTPTIKVNKLKFERLVTNIIQNSLDQKAKNLKIYLRENSLIFHDDGGGADPATLMKINSGAKATTKKDGSGLGLFSIYTFAKKMKWKFEVDNRRNEDSYPKTHGMMVKFIFPISPIMPDKMVKV